jgi:MFS family permease
LRLFFFDLGLSGYFFLFNLFLTARGYSEARLGVLAGVLAAGNLAGALPAGKLIRRYGPRNAVLSCLFLTPAAFCLRALLLSLSQQILLAFVAGIVLSLWAVCIPPAVAQSTRDEARPFAFGLLFSMGIGVAAVGGWLASKMPGWLHNVSLRGHLIPSDQLTLLAACCIAAIGVLPAAGMVSSRIVPSASRRALLTPSLRRFLPAAAVWALVTGSFSPFANVFLAVHEHLPLPRVGALFSISQLVQVGAVLCAPLIFRRCGVVTGVVSAQLATALCFALLALSHGSFAISIVYVALTGAQWMNEPGIYSILMSVAEPEQRGSASASMSFAVACAQLIASASAGWAFSRFGYPLVFAVISAIAVAAAGLFWNIPREPRDAPQECGAEA